MNSVKDKKEKVGRMLLMHANDREDIQIGLRRRHRRACGPQGHHDRRHAVRIRTRRSSSSGWNSPIRSSRSRSSPRPRPTRRRWASRSIAWRARTRRFRVTTDHESGQTIIKGMGELHLEILVDRMKREFKVEANVGAPQVAYREYLASRSSSTYTHKKQSGGSGQFGEVKVERRSRRARLGLPVLRRDQGRQRPARNISRRSRRACARPPRPAR